MGGHLRRRIPGSHGGAFVTSQRYQGDRSVATIDDSLSGLPEITLVALRVTQRSPAVGCPGGPFPAAVAADSVAVEGTRAPRACNAPAESISWKWRCGAVELPV